MVWLVSLVFLVYHTDVLRAQLTRQGHCGFSPHDKPEQWLVTKTGLGGITAAKNSYPWIVNFRRKEGKEWRHFCGGVILQIGKEKESDIVLTAAECIIRGDFEIVAGAHEITKNERGIQKAEPIHVAAAGYPNDVALAPTIDGLALVKVKPSFKFNDKVQPICLPDSHVPDDEWQELTGIVAGWGPKKANSGPSEILKLMKVEKLLSNKRCGRSFQEYNHTIMYCAYMADGYSGTCEADAGTPYFVAESVGYGHQGQATVFGVVSKHCEEHLSPIIYVRVKEHMPWITQQIKVLADPVKG